MSLVVLGLSHRSAPIDVLEAAALDRQRAHDLEGALIAEGGLAEAMVVSTCNRIELYAEGPSFHATVRSLGGSFSTAAGVPLERLRPHLYVHYEEAALSHLFSVACGLDSMAVGEPQVLGQIRDALASAQKAGHVGGDLGVVMQQALRVGKRAHSETAIDTVSRSLVTIGLARIEDLLGPIAGLRVLIVGAGAMAGLAAATVHRAGAAAIRVVNRTDSSAHVLAQRHGGSAALWSQRDAECVAADVIITTTGATGALISADDAVAARAARDSDQVYLDLALPRDVAAEVDDLPGVTVIGLEDLGRLAPAGGAVTVASPAADGVLVTDSGDVSCPDVADGVLVRRPGEVPPLTMGSGEPTPLHTDPQSRTVVDAVRELVAEEVAAVLADRRANTVGPLVAALRSRASAVVNTEMERLTRRSDLTADQAEAVHRTLHRTVDKLLHTPTMQLKRLAASDAAGDYASVLGDLFDLHDFDDGRQVPGGAA